MYLFIISTPLQFLNSLEARSTYDLPKEKCILYIYARNEWSLSSILLLAKECGWNNIHVDHINILPGQKRSFLSWLNRLLWFWSVKCSLPKLEYCFSAMFIDPEIRHLTNILNPTKLILMDEGIGQIHLLDSYLRLVKNSNKRNKGIRGRLLGYNPAARSDFAIFTAYQLQNFSKIKIQIHSYQYVKSFFGRNSHIVIKNSALFIGWPSHCHVNEKNYLKLMTKVFEWLRTKGIRNIQYIPHKLNSNWLLKEISAFKDTTIIRLKLPLEVHLLKAEQFPTTIAGFASSAVENIRQLFTNEETNFLVFDMLSLDAQMKHEASQSSVDEHNKFVALNQPIYQYFRTISDKRLKVIKF
jgi:hypothetical protein